MRHFSPAGEYWVDAWQRSILFLDALRQRGDTYVERTKQLAPHVLDFGAELVMDGRTLSRPVNYVLVRVLPPVDVTTDPTKRPFIVFDPRAGHGPGIGGMKHDSEIGVALRAGHPCYFVGFLPEPISGQTIEDVCHAEAQFVRKVSALHPDADSKPCLIGNCQAGWQIMMMAAMTPDSVGPIILAGAPLSYWAGVHGKNPLRYLGGMLGGTWLTALAGDLGHGIFDGAALVANFEQMNPANTCWKKPYNAFSKIDTEAARFLDFETWWGSPVLLNAEEMQWIADNLFVGNKLTSGEIRTSTGVKVDLRNIRSPIVVFCSWGDDITPPQQALGWITDLYASDADLAKSGQTIIYTLHHSIGHLGIFVSGKVAVKEHDQFINCMDMIDVLPPGLYEAVIADIDETIEHRDLVYGRYLFRIEPRTLADIHALGGNDAEDERRFETAARVSEVNKALYENFMAPIVKSVSNQHTAELARRLHANSARFEMMSSQNPFMWPVRAWADMIRDRRAPAVANNPFLANEHAFSEAMTSGLEAFGKMRDALTETMFLTVYGAPLLQAAVGLSDGKTPPRRREARDLAHEAATSNLHAALEKRVEHGGLIEAALRALIFVVRGERTVDERVFAALMQEREANRPDARISLMQLKELLREQALIVRMDEERAVAAIPRMLPGDDAARTKALAAIQRVVSSQGQLTDEMARRFARVEALFTTEPAQIVAPEATVAAAAARAPAGQRIKK